MKEIIIFTFRNSKEFLVDALNVVQVDLGIVSIISNKENLEGAIRENRPKIVLINGELPDELFLDCIDITEKAISNFGIDTNLCVFGKDRKTPGTIFFPQPIDLKFFYQSKIKKPGI